MKWLAAFAVIPVGIIGVLCAISIIGSLLSSIF